MGHSSSNLHELSHTDQSYNLLIAGYLRSLLHESCIQTDHSCLILNSDIPSMLIRLCVDFYCSKLHGHLILWSGTKSSGNRACNNIHLIKIDDHDRIYKMNIHNLDDNDYPNVNFMEDAFDRIGASYSLLSNVKKLPQWVLTKYPSTFGDSGSFYKKQRPKLLQIHSKTPRKQNDKLYNIIVRIGGDMQETEGMANTTPKHMGMMHQTRADVIIFAANITNARNDNLIEAFYCKIDAYEIPKLRETSTIHSHHYNRLILGYGGLKGTNHNVHNQIYSLNIDTLHYQTYCHLNEPLQGTSLCVNNHKDLMLFGGSNTHAFLLKHEYIQSQNDGDFSGGKCVKLADMKHSRVFCGSTGLYNNNDKVFVGGGEVEGDNSDHSVVEMYDINRDKWVNVGGKTSKKHAFHPCLWNDVTNNNILYIAGNKCASNHVKKLGFVEWVDLRSNKKKWNVMWSEPINRLFGLRKKNHTDKKNWISRSLLI